MRWNVWDGWVVLDGVCMYVYVVRYVLEEGMFPLFLWIWMCFAVFTVNISVYSRPRDMYEGPSDCMKFEMVSLYRIK